MDAQYWHQKWDEEKIGFHQSDVNRRLIKYWPELVAQNHLISGNSRGCVFVPLCGKSLDMLWLHQQGHRVLGIELSEKAAQAFFDENRLSCERREIDDFLQFAGTEQADGITILVGDYFAMREEQCASCETFYDRAAMIAMNPDMRERYATHLARLMPDDSTGLLLTISYDQSRMDGPPFSVSDENARGLLASNFDIDELAHYSGPERVGNLADRGLESLDERVYLLSRHKRS